MNDIIINKNFVLKILNHVGSPTSINHTYICLIPKIPNPIRPSYFRPISLCNVILKIVTKALAKRIIFQILLMITRG